MKYIGIDNNIRLARTNNLNNKERKIYQQFNET